MSKVIFPIAGAEHNYAGMPLFDGVPEHFPDYLDALLEYAGLEGALLWANEYRNDYVLTTGEHAGAKIPGTLFWGESTDSVQGYKTDFPCIMGMGQSWNRELVHKIGEVLGREYICQTDPGVQDSARYSAMLCTAIQDMRINPLSGRFDEGFSEDPMLSGVMVDEMARGVSGIDAPENPTGFWHRSCVVTKHFTTYGGQSFRMAQSSDAGMRSLMEYHVKAPVRGISSGAVGGFMMSFGRTNGVPNTISPAISYMQSLSPYGLYTTPDIFGTSIFWQRGGYGENGAFSNGYDASYIDPKAERTSAALLAHAECGGYVMTPETVEESMRELLTIVQAGALEIDIDEICRAAKYNLAAFVRGGFLNARLADYPFLSQCSETADENSPEHQSIALQAARESIVLLKNNGLLPLSGGEKTGVCGFMGESRFKTVYACRNLPRLEHCGMTPSQAVSEFAANAVYYSGGRQVRIKCADKYLCVADTNPESESFGAIGFTDRAGDAEIFELYSWGQGRAFSFRSVSSGRWISSNGVRPHFLAPEQPTVMKVNGEHDLVFRDSTLSGVLSGMGLPTRLRLEENEDGSYYMVVNSYNESLLQRSPASYYEMGRLLYVEDGKLLFTEPLADSANAAEMKKTASRFELETVKNVGEDIRTADIDTAIVVIGAATRHSAGEGVDRSELALGEEQYELAHVTAAAHPGRTVVVITAPFPVAAQQLEEDDNIAAIVYQPYAGQYDGWALGEVLFGRYAPTGRLTATWYADTCALPRLDEYSVPEGADTMYNPFELDPRISVDFKKQDLIAERLTYQYTAAPVTYPMGHGISYSSFELSDMQVSDWQDVSQPLEVSVCLENTGAVATSQVVQVYMSNPGSAYGSAAPVRTLAAFEKLALEPGEKRTVTMRVMPQDVCVWDVNADKYIVEQGEWTVAAGFSSGDIRLSADITVCGERLACLDTSESLSLHSRSFAASDVTYREYGKQRTVRNLKAQHGLDGIAACYYAVMGKRDGAWSALRGVNLDGLGSVSVTAASVRQDNLVELRLDAPDGELLAELRFAGTQPVRYSIANTGESPELYPRAQVHELGYRRVCAPLAAAQGVHDVYVVFRNPDARIAEIKLG